MPLPGAVLAGSNVLGGILGSDFPPHIRFPSFGIGKPRFRSKVDWSDPEWLKFHAAVMRLKREDGSQAFGPKDDIGGAWRWLLGDFPRPDRDASDAKNRAAMEFLVREIERLAALPINAGVFKEVKPPSGAKVAGGGRAGSNLADWLSNIGEKLSSLFRQSQTDLGAAAGQAAARNIGPWLIAGTVILGAVLLARKS